MEDIPVATEWLLNSVDGETKDTIASIFMIICPKTDIKGTGFLHKSGYILTCYHVIEKVTSLSDIIAISSNGKQVGFTDIIIDRNRDLVLLKPKEKLENGLEIDLDTKITPEVQVSTWGYPLEYNGPAPLLSTGYVSGFRQNEINGSKPVKRIIVNGAFNKGNSGGPLFLFGKNKVVGVVVSKRMPLSTYHMSALRALENQKSGFTYDQRDGSGKIIRTLSEAQVVADILTWYREVSQFVLGEAIAREELITFLEENKVEI